jgi:hypothetical protein
MHCSRISHSYLASGHFYGISFLSSIAFGQRSVGYSRQAGLSEKPAAI